MGVLFIILHLDILRKNMPQVTVCVVYVLLDLGFTIRFDIFVGQ